jgi:BlaI family penicillinase repressor
MDKDNSKLLASLAVFRELYDSEKDIYSIIASFLNDLIRKEKLNVIGINEITEKLTQISSWSPKTIQTLIKRLVSKKALTYEKQSRVFVYTPLVKEDEYIRQESNSFLKRYDNITSMLASYIEDDKLSEEDIASLRNLLSNH